jgi:hypothetical protein
MSWVLEMACIVSIIMPIGKMWFILKFFFFFFLVTRHSFNKQGSQRPYNKTKQQRGVDLYHYKWRRKEGGGEKISENAVQEYSCCGPKSHMVGTEVSTSVNFFSFPKGRKMDKVLAITDSICQSNVMEGLLRAAITTKESPSRENLWRFKEAAKEAASQAARASPKFGSHGGLV